MPGTWGPQSLSSIIQPGFWAARWKNLLRGVFSNAASPPREDGKPGWVADPRGAGADSSRKVPAEDGNARTRARVLACARGWQLRYIWRAALCLPSPVVGTPRRRGRAAAAVLVSAFKDDFSLHLESRLAQSRSNESIHRGQKRRVNQASLNVAEFFRE